MGTPEAQKEEPKATTTTKRDRSPNYPALTFTEALACAKQIWEKDKKHPVSLDLASQHMGYKKKNGASMPQIAAMKRYGLLTSVGNDVRISDDGHALFVFPEGSPEREALIKKLAVRPALFGEVLKKFPDGLPSDANLRARLQTDWEFASEKAADTFITALREAVRIAGVQGVATGGDGTDNGSADNAEPAMTNQAQTTVTTQNQTITPPIKLVTPPPGTQARPWDLGDGVTVTVVLPNKLSRKNIARMKKYINVLEAESSISWDDAADEAQGGEA